MRLIFWLAQIANSYAIRLATHGRGLVLPTDLSQLHVPRIVYDSPQNDNTPPTLIDFTSYMLPVKNQGHCGSCYAFAAISVVEAQINRMSIASGHAPILEPLSVAEIVDCSFLTGDSGCNGGWPGAVFDYVKEYGVCQAMTYPYVAHEATCKATCLKHDRVHVRGYGLIQASTHTDLAQALAIHGPLAVGIDATNLHAYHDGVYTNCTTPYNLNHAVVLVGIVERHGELVFKVQNSWGADFGQDGFFYVGFNSTNDCGLAEFASFVML